MNKKSETTEDIETLVEQGRELASQVRDKAVTKIKAIHEVVHENPYKAVAIAAGVGAVIGFLLGPAGIIWKRRMNTNLTIHTIQNS